VGELRAACDITGCPNMVGRGTQLLVDGDKTTVGQLHAGRLEAQIGRHWGAASGDEQFLAADL
jgi:hypothetical protein